LSIWEEILVTLTLSIVIRGACLSGVLLWFLFDLLVGYFIYLFIYLCLLTLRRTNQLREYVALTIFSHYCFHSISGISLSLADSPLRCAALPLSTLYGV
jgi:hypothetical protein